MDEIRKPINSVSYLLVYQYYNCVSDGKDYIKLSNDIFTFMDNLFMDNELNLNFNETNVMKFVNNKKSITDIN
jgi:hypothetical protein